MIIAITTFQLESFIKARTLLSGCTATVRNESYLKLRYMNHVISCDEYKEATLTVILIHLRYLPVTSDSPHTRDSPSTPSETHPVSVQEEQLLLLSMASLFLNGCSSFLNGGLHPGNQVLRRPLQRLAISNGTIHVASMNRKGESYQVEV